jgi:hypothetical protein
VLSEERSTAVATIANMELRLDHTRITSAELGRHTKRLTPYLGELRKIVKSGSYDAARKLCRSSVRCFAD